MAEGGSVSWVKRRVVHATMVFSRTSVDSDPLK